MKSEEVSGLAIDTIKSLHYKISREKLEPEPGFEPRTSGDLIM